MRIKHWVEHDSGIMLLAYDDPKGSRMDRLTAVAEGIENNDSRISYLLDHKGMLTVSWHKYDPLLAHELSVLWRVIGNEPSEYIEHLPKETP